MAQIGNSTSRQQLTKIVERKQTQKQSQKENSQYKKSSESKLDLIQERKSTENLKSALYKT